MQHTGPDILSPEHLAEVLNTFILGEDDHLLLLLLVVIFIRVHGFPNVLLEPLQLFAHQLIRTMHPDRLVKNNNLLLSILVLSRL